MFLERQVKSFAPGNVGQSIVPKQVNEMAHESMEPMDRKKAAFIPHTDLSVGVLTVLYQGALKLAAAW